MVFVIGIDLGIPFPATVNIARRSARTWLGSVVVVQRADLFQSLAKRRCVSRFSLCLWIVASVVQDDVFMGFFIGFSRRSWEASGGCGTLPIRFLRRLCGSHRDGERHEEKTPGFRHG